MLSCVCTPNLPLLLKIMQGAGAAIHNEQTWAPEMPFVLGALLQGAAGAPRELLRVGTQHCPHPLLSQENVNSQQTARFPHSLGWNKLSSSPPLLFL